MQVFGHFGIGGGILLIAPVHDGMQVSAGYRILAGEQSHVPAPGGQSFGDITSHCLPGTVLPGRRSPCYRRQDGDPLFRNSHVGIRVLKTAPWRPRLSKLLKTGERFLSHGRQGVVVTNLG
jgi:hypothetical protein